MYFSHAVGANILGAYFLFVAYYSVISTVSDGGFGNATVKRISEGEEQNKYFTAYFVLRTFFIGCSIVFLLLFRSFFGNIDEAGLFVLLLVLLFFSIFQGTIGAGIAGTGKMGIYSSCNALGIISSTFFQVVSIFLGYGIVGLAMGIIVGAVIKGGIEYFFLDVHFSRFQWRHVKSLFSLSFWIFLTSGGLMTLSYVDTVLVGHFMNTTAVGVYKVAFQLSTVSAFFISALTSVLWPRINKWGKKKELSLVQESLSRALSYSFVLAIPVSIGGIIFGDKILSAFYGKEFIVGYSALCIFFLVQIVNVFQSFFTIYLDALNFLRQSFIITATGAAVNIILNIILIPRLGIIGGAVALLLSIILNAILARRILSKIISIKLEWRSVGNILFSSCIMAISAIGIRYVIPLSSVWIILCAVIFCAAVFIYSMIKLDRKIFGELMDILKKMRTVEAQEA